MENCTQQHTISKRSLRCGEKAPNARLSLDQVNEIRKLHMIGSSYRSLAKRFVCDPKTIANIIMQRTWYNIH